MTKVIRSLKVMALVSLLTACSMPFQEPQELEPVWKTDLKSEVQALGYRNWIVIADASFPFHNRQGVRTVVAPVETPEIVHAVISNIEETQHIKPQFYTARELRSVSNDRAPGITNFRKDLKTALHGHVPRELDESTLQRLLQGTSSSYAVLVIKTQTALPYSSVFIELDSGYWDGDSERELRKKMQKNTSLHPQPRDFGGDGGVALLD